MPISEPNLPSGTIQPEKRPFQAILFDLGNTLIYFDGEWEAIQGERDAALIQRLHQAGISPDGKAFLSQFNDQMEAYYAEREFEFIEHTTAYLLRSLLAEWGYAQVSEEVIRSALADMYAMSQAYWKTEADAHPTLQALRAQGYQLGLISNGGDDADIQTLIDQAELRTYFDVILTSAAQGIRKPNPRIFLNALERLSLPPSQAAMVGDSLGADILGARNAGVFSIWITRRSDTAANLAHEDTIQPDAVVESLSELLPLFESLSTHPKNDDRAHPPSPFPEGRGKNSGN